MACKHSICGVCGGKKTHTKYVGIGATLNDICSGKCQAALKDECSCKCQGKFHKGANKDLMDFLLEPSSYAPIEKSKSKKVIFQPITMYDYLAEFLNGVRIKTSSFDRHSDRNYRKDNKKLTLFWLSPKGQNIDTLANDFINETGFSNYEESDIINAIVNYINDYPSGLKQYIKDVEAERIRAEEFYGQGMYENNYNNEAIIFGQMKLKKGSAAAKAYMAKIRAAKGKKTSSKKVYGVLDTLKRKGVAAKKNVAYSVIDKTLKNSPKKTAKDVLNRAKGIIKNTYIGAAKKVNKAKKAPLKKVNGYHKDTKSHNVNIRVVSGTRKTGFISGLIIKSYTLSELKKINPIYFDKGNDKFFGVYKRKLIISKKLNSQVMIEASKNIFGGEIIRKYTVRMIKPNGEIDTPKTFNTIFAAADYIGKNIIL